MILSEFETDLLLLCKWCMPLLHQNFSCNCHLTVFSYTLGTHFIDKPYAVILDNNLGIYPDEPGINPRIVKEINILPIEVYS